MHDDDWLMEFNNRAAPRLREIFERDLDGIPSSMSDLLARLRQTERATTAAR